MTAIEPSTSEAKCSASAASAWLWVSRAVRCSARARQKLTAISISSTTKGIAESVGGGAPSRKPAPGFDQDAAGQHVKQRDDNERRQALELAVAVMMLLVGRLVGNPDHQPGDDGRDHVDRGVQGLRDQRERADRDADREFRRGHAGAGENRDRGDVRFVGVGSCCGCAHGRRFSSPSVNIKRRSQAQSPLTCRSGLTSAICCELFRVKEPSLRATGRRTSPSEGEAIHRSAYEGDNGFASLASGVARNDGLCTEYDSAFSRRDAPEVFKIFALRKRGRRECRVLAAPAVSCASVHRNAHTSIQVQTEHPGIPCAMALRLISCSPRRRLSCHRHWRDLPPT